MNLSDYYNTYTKQGTVLDGLNLRITHGDIDGLHLVFARNGGTHTFTVDRLINSGDWRYAYLRNDKELAAIVQDVDLPPLTSKIYPCEVVFCALKDAVIYCSPIPDDMSTDEWHSAITFYEHVSRNGIGPDASVSDLVVLIALILLMNRKPHLVRKSLPGVDNDVHRFLVQQCRRGLSILERCLPLESFPY